jgi:hypothetical protein
MSLSTDPARQAQVQCQRALEHFQKGNRAAAIKALGAALDIDRSLKNDERIQRFAAHLTGQPAEQALAALTDVSQREALIMRLGTRKPGTSMPLQSRPLWIFGTVIICLTFMAILALVLSGQLTANTFNLLAGKGQVEKFQLESRLEQEYFIAVPLGLPPEDGWPTLVAVHGAGQTGQDMVNALGEATKNNGILLIAPTFTAIRDDAAFYEDGRNTVLLIMEEVKQKTFSQPSLYPHFLGAVYFGYGEGGPLVTYVAWKGLNYAEVGYTMDGPLGVALVNSRAPLFDAPAYVIGLPYLLLYGELAPQAGISRDYNNRLTGQGAQVMLTAAAGADEKMTAEQVDRVVGFVLQMYQVSNVITTI